MTDPLFIFDAVHDAIPVNSDEINTGWNLTLPDSVKRHALASMRMRIGDDLQLSDGHGLRIRARLMDDVQGLAQVLEVGREPRPFTRIALVQALAKQGHDERAVDTATQIGVDVVLPWQANRSIAKWKPGKSERRWGDILISSCEQSRRSWIPNLGGCLTSRQLITMCERASERGDLVIVLHQDADITWQDALTSIGELAAISAQDGSVRTICIVVGPEGGISEDEIARFSACGAHCCSLGHNILRASTAGPVAVSLVSQALGRFS